MSERDSIQSDEGGEARESDAVESSESQALNNATHEPRAQVEDTQSVGVAEEVEGVFSELMDTAADSPKPEALVEEGEEGRGSGTTAEAPDGPPEIAEEELDTLAHTLVGKGPVPTAPLYDEGSESPAAAEAGEALETSEAVIDVVARVLSDPEFRQNFFSDPDEALADQVLTRDERQALKALKEETVVEFSSEFENRDVGYAPPYVPVRPSEEGQINVSQLLKAELTDEDLQRLLGSK
jgi:hypothetical protein